MSSRVFDDLEESEEEEEEEESGWENPNDFDECDPFLEIDTDP